MLLNKVSHTVILLTVHLWPIPEDGIENGVLLPGGERASHHSRQQEALGAGADSGGAQLPVQGQCKHWQQRCQQLY